jgi:hypothetical protein
MRPPKSKRLQQRAAADAPITDAIIRDLLQKMVLNTRLVMPGDGELTALARCCERWRRQCQIEREMAAIGLLQQKALKAAEAWGGALTELRVALIEQMPRASPRDQSYLERIIACLDADIPAAKRAAGAKIDHIPIGLRGAVGADDRWTVGAKYLDQIGGNGLTKWQIYAAPLGDDLRAALRPENPHAKLEVKPVARFLAALAPLLTGERPSTGSVELQLKALRRKNG